MKRIKERIRDLWNGSVYSGVLLYVYTVPLYILYRYTLLSTICIVTVTV